MLRCMYSGISGMKSNQTKLDVSGNNIANVGTTAFKSSRVRFQDMLSQNVSQALGPGRNTGGINPRQVGLGVQVAGIDTIVSQGMMQPTSRNLDIAMDGSGYFVVSRGAVPERNAGGISVDPLSHTMGGGDSQISFTRDGALTLDHQGNLLTSDGYRVMGYALKEKNGSNSGILSVDYDKNGHVSFVNSDSVGGLEASGNLVPLRIPDSIYINADNISKENPIKMKYIGSGEKSKITTEAKIDTNGAKFQGKSDLNIEIKAVEEEADGKKTYDYKVFINGEQLNLENNQNSPIAIDKGVITNHIKAKLGYSTDSNADINKQNEIAKIAQEQARDMIGDSTINLTEPTLENGIEGKDKQKYSWSYTLTAEGDKKIRSFSIGKDGVINAVLDNGSVSALGQLAVASFKNPEGLNKMGRNLLQNTANSGVPVIRSGIGCDPAHDNGDGYGDMLQGMLEMSNVDLAEQFTDMIVTTRSFQAAGKMISTGDEILQDIINLKR